MVFPALNWPYNWMIELIWPFYGYRLVPGGFLVGLWLLNHWQTTGYVCMLRIWNKNPKNALISVYKWNSITLKLLYWFPIEFWNKIWLTNYSSSGFVIEMRDLFALLMIMQRLVSWIIRVIMVIRLHITNSMRQDNNYIIMWLQCLKINYSD